MSGRAGRRGKDDKGIVLQVLDEKMEPAVAKGILYGEADRLDSSYHVTYNMLLNLLRVEGADPDYLVRSSFHQYQQEADAPALVARRRRWRLKRSAGQGGDATDAAATKAPSPRRRLAAAETDVIALSRAAHCIRGSRRAGSRRSSRRRLGADPRPRRRWASASSCARKPRRVKRSRRSTPASPVALWRRETRTRGPRTSSTSWSPTTTAARS